MYIAIYAAGMPFNGDTIKSGKSLGGSETAAYYMAKELAALGHQVIVFTSSPSVGTWDSMRYEYIGKVTQQTPLGDRFHYVLQSPHDVLIMQRNPQGFLFPYNSKLNIWWLHDLARHRTNSLAQPHLLNIDKLFAVSNFHAEQISAVHGIDKAYIYATKNGVDYENPVFKETAERIPRSLFYMARPERGLENLVGNGGIMEQLEDCHLYVAGYDNTTQQMEAYYKQLWRRCDELPNVTNLGALGKDELYRHLKKCMLYIYPSTFEETSCIAALESQACGTPFIGCKTGALPETLAGGGAILIKNNENGIDKKKFCKTITQILADKIRWELLSEQTKNIVHSWTKIAAEWTEEFEKLLALKCQDKKRLWSHLEQMSDIVALTKAGATQDNYPSLKDNYEFFLKNDYKDHYKRYYEYEKNRGVNYGPENLFNNARFEITLQLIDRLKPKRILDYGCAHGHYVLNLAKRLSDVKFVGVDLEETNINKAIEWAKTEKMSDRCEFICGEAGSLDFKEPDKFDIILVEEVLEHVISPQAIINQLKPLLNAGGSFIVSVPYGPWEAIGYKEHKGWRAHIHHLERQDLFEIFGKQKNYRLLSLPYANNLGHYLVTFAGSPAELGEINYDRKIRMQSPRETLTVTMIAKNEENSIGRALRSIQDIADEIIIGIDKDSVDSTEEIAIKYGAKVIKIESPMKSGFAAARNEVIKLATCDWIMWIDADETFEQIENLNKYLRNNCYNAYAIKQHHYAVEPPALFKTDYPCRIFRNNKNIKFFGVVHEHPETALNKGIGKMIILPDVSIMHTGYCTERIRRARFARNYPLMMRDREENPERTIGLYLWCRDLAHANRYMLEKNGNVVTHEIVRNANESIDAWRELVKRSNMRMVIDALQFYSESVRILGHGINYALYLDAAPATAKLKNPDNVMSGTFANTDDIKLFTNQLLKNNISIYDEKYY